MFSIKAATFAMIAFAAGKALAETHTITFNNNCGRGTPMLISQTGQVLSTGGAFTSNGPLRGAIAYLQTGMTTRNSSSQYLNLNNCEQAAAVSTARVARFLETTLVNPSTAGSGSSTDLSLIPPHAFSVTTGFGYIGGCAPAGADCNNANCNTAFHVPTDTFVQVACQQDNANLVVCFLFGLLFDTRLNPCA
ncbi:hypothetical protein B0H14DRAFT_2811463 [Mycena olivaceomarginata]|nr:hypothetical protein B0H14DRAFT_2811463 [Mycena olivaceomarginata]